MPRRIPQIKYCEMCGNPIPFQYSSGKTCYKYAYERRRFCSRTCKSEFQRNSQKKENPRVKDRLYHVWLGMKERCNNPNMNTAKWYSQKGIRVCDEWEHDFDKFKEWSLENGYDYSKSRKEQSIDRIDGDKGYSPDNCRWVTHSINCRNTRRNVMLTHDGKTLCATEWAEITGIPARTLLKRHSQGLSEKRVFAKEKFAYRSNTGIKGITWNEKKQWYVVYADGHRYLGIRRKLDDAISLRKESMNGHK